MSGKGDKAGKRCYTELTLFGQIIKATSQTAENGAAVIRGRGGTAVKTGQLTKRAAALLLALLLAAGLVPSAAAESPAVPAPAPFDVELVMAGNAVAGYGIKGPGGAPLKPRKAPDMKGRGIADSPGAEPDYRGVVGYVSLQDSWSVSWFNTFTQTPWQMPFYEEKDGVWKVAGTVRHKTPVLVVDQRIREGLGHKYTGYLRVIRLDNNHMGWIDAAQFVTVPYWTYELKDAVRYGYCIAVYRDRSRHGPMDRKKHRGTLPDGLRILMCYTVSARYFSPDKADNPLLGIVFRSREKQDAYARTFLFFNENDLTLVY